ncbi:MAG: acyltransferase [Bacteroidales bacterium]|jgi:peptidoglycan/LPS O-acetylase OafA/YrhL|nr:acyltransferase [Bacteroidales bacterium]
MENNVENIVLQKSKRDARYELIRVLSIMLVLLVHVNSSYTNQDSFFVSGSVIREFISATFLCCNGLFFILSGKFALNFDETKSSYRDYYFKKLVYLLLPMLLYMAIETLAYTIIDSTGNFAESLFHNVTSRFTHKHYWFLFTIMFDLMVAPVFAKAFRNMPDKIMLIFFALGIIHLTFFSFGPLISGWFAYESPFSNFHFHFFLGGIIDRVINYFGKKRLIVIGLICFILLRVQVMKLGYADFIYDFSPFYLFFVLATWIIFCEIYNLIGQKSDKVILFLGKYSFPVYLIHYMLLAALTSEKWKSMFTDYPFYILITFVCLFAISLLSSVIIDKLFLQHVQKGLNWGYKKLRNQARQNG